MQSNYIFLILIIVYLILTIAFGVRRAKKSDSGTVEDWFVAGGKMAWPFVGFATAAAWLDVASIFLNVGGGYDYGISAIWSLAGAEMLVFLLIIPFIRRIRNPKMITQAEMVEKRFGSGIRPWYAAVWVISLCGYASLSFLVFTEFLQYLFGLNQFVAAAICLAVVLTMQMLGGATAGMYSDIVQGSMIIIGSLVLGIFAASRAGGWTAVMTAVPEMHLNLFGGDFMGVLAGLIPLTLGFLIEPTLWTRVIAARSVKDSRKANILAFVIYIPVCFGTLLAGLAAYSLYPEWNESLNMLPVNMADTLFHPVISGLIFLAMVASLLAAFNSFMGGANMNLCYDLIPSIYKSIKKEEFPQEKIRPLCRVGIVIVGCTSTILSILIPTLSGILEFAASLATSGILVSIVAMFFSKRANGVGAAASFGLGTVSQLVLSIVGTPGDIPAWLISLPISILAMIIGTIIGKKKPTPEQLAPFTLDQGAGAE